MVNVRYRVNLFSFVIRQMRIASHGNTSLSSGQQADIKSAGVLDFVSELRGWHADLCPSHIDPR